METVLVLAVLFAIQFLPLRPYTQMPPHLTSIPIWGDSPECRIGYSLLERAPGAGALDPK